MRRLIGSILVVLPIAACSGGDGLVLPLAASPAHGSLAGQIPVVFTGYRGEIGPLDVTKDSFELGHFALVQVTVTSAADGSQTISGTTQGDYAPGPVDLYVTTPEGSAAAIDAFTYDPPVGGAPLVFMAFGASLTEGIQSLGLSADTQRHGVSQVIAEQAGVFLGLPLFAAGIFPPRTLADFNADCTLKPGAGGINESAILKHLTDPMTGEIDLRLARLDWTLVPRDIAIGGETVGDILTGPTDFKAVFENITERPDVTGGDLLAAPPQSQIDRVVALDPAVGFSTDLLFNDLDPSITQTDDLHPDLITPVATVRPLLDQMLARLGALHGQYFLASSPHFDFLPAIATLRAQFVPAKETEAQFDSKLAAIDSLIDQYDAMLASDVMPYPNLHVVDFAKRADELVTSPPVVDGMTLTTKHFGGLLSLDDLHFTNSGYAIYAGLFIDSINSVLHTTIPQPDLAAVVAADPLTPKNLAAAGFTCVP